MIKRLGIVLVALVSVTLDILLSMLLTVIVAVVCLIVLPVFSIFGTYHLCKIKLKGVS